MNNQYTTSYYPLKRVISHTILIMFLLTVGLVQIHASHYAKNQALTISVKNESLEKVFKIIESQSEFLFFYNTNEIRKENKISINKQNSSIYEILNDISTKLGVDYIIKDRHIILSPHLEEITTAIIAEQSIKKITGTVLDEYGDPIVGASVAEKGTTNGVTTDINGKFSLEVNDNAILQITFLGHKNQEILVGDQNNILATLVEDTKMLDEVVVVGYGTQKKVNLSGAVDVIDNKQLAERQAATVSQLLQGVAPGFNFDVGNEGGFQPGATMNMTVRGMGSLNGGAPYIIIDGFPGDINNLNPDDIESISVLKDAAASAIYGARAAYGVIIVTTKKGKKNEKIKINYSGNLIINTPQKLPKSLEPV